MILTAFIIQLLIEMCSIELKEMYAIKWINILKFYVIIYYLYPVLYLVLEDAVRVCF